MRLVRLLSCAALLTLLVMARAANAQPSMLAPGDLPPSGVVEDQPPFVDVYTFGTGAEIFEKWGHGALCLRYHDPHKQPICFNYGITNFDDVPGLVWGFLRTKAKFWVEPWNLSPMIRFYKSEDRSIWVQHLNLTGEQSRKLEAKLWNASREENRYYYYDHFYDNCTTRMRDLIDYATDGALSKNSTDLFPMTFREAGTRGLAEYPLLLSITDFTVGRVLDHRRGPPLPSAADPKPIANFGRWFTTLLAFAFGLPLLLARWRQRFERLATAWASIPLVFWGVLIWTVLCISSIPTLRWNEAVFVLVPFDIVWPFLRPERRRNYSRVRVVMLLLVSVLVTIGVFKQPLWVPILTAFLPHAIIAFDLPWMGRPRPSASRSPAV